MLAQSQYLKVIFKQSQKMNSNIKMALITAIKTGNPQLVELSCGQSSFFC